MERQNNQEPQNPLLNNGILGVCNYCNSYDRLYSALFADLSQKEKGELDEHLTLLLLDFYVSWIEKYQPSYLYIA